MSTWRNTTYMRRRQMRLMVEEQHRAQQRQLMAAAQAFTKSLALGQQSTVDAFAKALQDASDLDGQAHVLHTRLH